MKINFVCRQVYKDVNLLLLFVLLSFAYYRNLMFYAIFHCSRVGPRVRSVPRTCIYALYTCESCPKYWTEIPSPSNAVHFRCGDGISPKLFVIVVGSLSCVCFGCAGDFRPELAIRKIIVILIIFCSLPYCLALRCAIALKSLHYSKGKKK